jgi:hypothetical protein
MFQAEFREALLNGTKTATIRRASSPNVKALLPGDIVVGTDGIFTKASDGFARFLVTETKLLRFSEIGAEHLATTRSTLDWYRNRYGALVGTMLFKYIKFVRLEDQPDA